MRSEAHNQGLPSRSRPAPRPGAVALLAGMAIFTIVFANGLEPGAGPGLVFVSLGVLEGVGLFQLPNS